MGAGAGLDAALGALPVIDAVVTVAARGLPPRKSPMRPSTNWLIETSLVSQYTFRSSYVPRLRETDRRDCFLAIWIGYPIDRAPVKGVPLFLGGLSLTFPYP
jgi:hypothetical protein